MDEFADHTIKVIDHWGDLMEAIAKDAEKAFSDLFFDRLTDRSMTFLDFMDQFTRAVLRSFANMLAKMLIESIKWETIMAGLKILSSFLGFGGVTPAPAKVMPTPVTLHKGGVVPRYQQGGVVPALLEPGEGVITRRGMAALGRDGLEMINRGAPGGGRQITNVYTINAIDVKTFRQYNFCLWNYC